jgi:hypothetical protein
MSPPCTGNPCTCLRGVPNNVMAAVRSIPKPRPTATTEIVCGCDDCEVERAREKATEDWRSLNDALRTAAELRAHPDRPL